VQDFRESLPGAVAVVFDNNSTDGTAAAAAAAGAQVFRERRQGKGFVVRRMFADIEADIYILVDGDGTYDAASAARMVDLLISNQLDMIVGSREDVDQKAYRRGHRAGNRIFSAFIAALFGPTFTDILSGYRVLSRRFVKSFPLMSQGFEIETELTVHALGLGLPVVEVTTPYRMRLEGSVSKLSTWGDGLKILRAMLSLLRAERPIVFFGVIAMILALVALALAVPLGITYVETGLVPRLPTAILCSALMLAAFLSLTCGMILDTVTRGRREAKLLAYLAVKAPEREWMIEQAPSDV
jgi:glycosyltransferase involved in cell wall biosynthesis